MKKTTEIKDMTADELRVKGRDLRQELFNLRLQQATSQLEKPSRMRTIRKDIARIETQLSTLRHTKKAA
jgi:large subunit ribosomal protein L29